MDKLKKGDGVFLKKVVNYNAMEPKFYRMSLDEKQQVKETLTNILLSKKEIRFAFIYGSFNDNSDDTPFRDIDVGVYTAGVDEKKSIDYSLELSDQLSSMLRITVDARVLNYAPVTFLFYVIRGELIVDRDEDSRCEFMEKVMRHYLDMKPLRLRSIKEAFAHGA